MEVVMFIFVIVFVIALCRYILVESERIEGQKKFMKNMNEYDKKNKKN